MPAFRNILKFITIMLVSSTVFATIWIYQVNPDLCNGCAGCIHWCSTGALSMQGGKAVIDPELCNGCGICEPRCPRGAIYETWYQGIEESESSMTPVYGPNPTPGTVQITGVSAGTGVHVLDISGRLIVSDETDHNGEVTFNLSGRAPGLYCVMLGNEIMWTITLIE